VDNFCSDCNKKYKLAKQQNSKPLPNSLCNEFSERITPQHFNYKNNCGKDVNFKFSPLKVFDRVQNFIPSIPHSMSSFYLCPNRTIMLHGIILPSQISPENKFSQSTYKEHIMFDVKSRQEDSNIDDEYDHDYDDDDEDDDNDTARYKHLDKGKIEFNEVVSFNSTIHIMFPTPLKLVKDKKYEMNIEFYVGGKYTLFDTKNEAKCGVTMINFDFYNSKEKFNSLLQGLIFDTRDQNITGTPRYCNSREEPFHGFSHGWNPWHSQSFDDEDEDEDEDGDDDDEDEDEDEDSDVY
jgi:hypothetical protein